MEQEMATPTPPKPIIYPDQSFLRFTIKFSPSGRPRMGVNIVTFNYSYAEYEGNPQGNADADTGTAGAADSAGSGESDKQVLIFPSQPTPGSTIPLQPYYGTEIAFRGRR